MPLAIRKITWTLLVLLLIGGISLGVGLRSELEARSPQKNPTASIAIADGMSLREIGETLRAEGLIAHPQLFVMLARWRGVDRKIRSGKYEFSGGSTMGEVLEGIVSGPQKLEFVVLPEGLSIEETAEILASAGLGNAENFRKLARDEDFAAALGVPATTLEGFLFPDTYAFAIGASPKEIFTHITERFFSIFTPEIAAEGKALGLSPLEIVTLASLIEKEAAVATERRQISAVFHNRLRRGMKLQSDPTAIYGLSTHSGRIRPRDLDRENPYNTYKISGLPPGPIANPGRASLIAAVHPAKDRKVLYFVARDDRTHVFSRSYRDHRSAIRDLR